MDITYGIHSILNIYVFIDAGVIRICISCICYFYWKLFWEKNYLIVIHPWIHIVHYYIDGISRPGALVSGSLFLYQLYLLPYRFDISWKKTISELDQYFANFVFLNAPMFVGNVGCHTLFTDIPDSKDSWIDNISISVQCIHIISLSFLLWSESLGYHGCYMVSISVDAISSCVHCIK